MEVSARIEEWGGDPALADKPQHSTKSSSSTKAESSAAEASSDPVQPVDEACSASCSSTARPGAQQTRGCEPSSSSSAVPGLAGGEEVAEIRDESDELVVTDPALLQHCVHVLAQLEHFCSEPAFTTGVG